MARRTKKYVLNSELTNFLSNSELTLRCFQKLLNWTRNNLVDSFAKYPEHVSEEKNICWHFTVYSLYISNG